MRSASHLSVIQPGDRPPPMVPADVELSDMPKAMLPLDMVRSSWALTCDDVEFRAGVTLWCASFHQTPAGSLPNDNRLLARLADFGRNAAAFAEIREKALEGWVECADGRLYRKSVAIEALSFWIKRLLKRKSSAVANAARWEKDEPADADAFDRQIFMAGDALARLDATNPLVQRIRAHRAKLTREATERGTTTVADVSPAAGAVAGSPSGIPIGSPKLSEAKRSQESSCEQSSHDAHAREIPDRVIEQTGGIPPDPEPEPAPWEPWPQDSWERFWAAVWLQAGTDAARRALEKVRKRKFVPFGELMIAMERYKGSKPDWQEWCHPATWLNQQRWRDGKPLPAGTRPTSLGGTVVELVFVERDTPAWQAWQTHAKRQGKSGFPDSQQQGSKRGWRFPSMWPPKPPDG